MDENDHPGYENHESERPIPGQRVFQAMAETGAVFFWESGEVILFWVSQFVVG